MEKRVLLLSPTPRDEQTTRSLLTTAGIECVSCETFSELSREVEKGAGAVLLTDDAITSEGIQILLQSLGKQPAWSDVPILTLMRGGVQSPVAARVLDALGNVTLLERPAPMRSVLSAVQAALRGRQRQYQLRDKIEQMDSAKKELDELVVQLNQSRVNERAARLEAERVSGLKDEFLATLSHELRTPLNAIFGWTQLLKRGKKDPETLAQGIDVIDRNVRLQTQLIEDLLDVSRIISGKVRLEMQSINLAEIIAAAIEGVTPSAQAKQIRLDKSIEAGAGPINGDPARLQQVFWNLLTNAIKFTPPAGTVRVQVRRERGVIEISVSDSGVGIDSSFVPFLFERFRQADGSSTRKHGGLGLGLSIVRSLVELHGGTVEARSGGSGQGATFIIRLPLGSAKDSSDEPVRASAAPTRCNPPNLRGLKVLVVDDEPDTRELVRRVLLDCEAETSLASSAAEAQMLVASFGPDVILSDIGMPLEDGYDFIREVRRRGIKTPAVALTAFARAEDRIRSIQAGYQIHLPKPVEAAELIAVVASLSGRFYRQAGSRSRRAGALSHSSGAHYHFDRGEGAFFFQEGEHERPS